jgi:uncharacterized protein
MFFNLLLVAALVFLSSCATYQSRIEQARTRLLSGDCAAAIESFKKLKNDSKDDKLLYLMEEASALQICNEFEQSNKALIEADKLSEELDYHSVSRIAGATLLNEELIQYKSNSFEKLFINALATINFLELGQYDDALVEARRINEKYNKLAAENKKSFELNSLAQYLSALSWELSGQYDDACIDYVKSYKLDPTFHYVGLSGLSACAKASRFKEFDELSKSLRPLPNELALAKQKNKNEIIIVFLQGLGPRKVFRPDYDIVPNLQPTLSITKKIQVAYQQAAVNKIQLSDSVYSVEKAALATLNSEVSSLAARRLGARVVKEVVADQIRQKDKGLGAVAWLLMVGSERADLRNWTLLPSTIQVVKVTADPGSKIQLQGLDAWSGLTDLNTEIDLSKNPGKKFYLIRSLK